MVRKEKFLNVGAIKADSTNLQGIVEIGSSGQITLTITDTDTDQKVVIGLPDPVNVLITDPVDNSTSAVNVIDYPHHEIHAGSRYEFCDNQTVASGASIQYMIETPAGTEQQHLTWSVSGSAITTVVVDEGGDRVGDSDVTARVYNRNRRSSNTTDILLDDSVTGGTTDGPDQIFCDHGGSAQGNFKTGNNVSERDEWILEASTKYLFTITSGTNGNLITTQLDFYEHTPDA